MTFALQEETDEQEQPSSAGAEASEEPSAQPTAPETAQQKLESEPATRFTPSEKIGAADTISLPVDI